MLNRNKWLDSLSNPLHTLTKGDIQTAAGLWAANNHSIMFALSPYRWGRSKTKFQPQSVYTLHNLITAWGNFNNNDPLSGDDARAIAKIIQQRINQGSHSSHDLFSNSGTIFQALTQCPEIGKFLPKPVLPNSIEDLCVSLTTLLNSQYKTAVSQSQFNRALKYIKLVQTLANEKLLAATGIANGESYSGSHGLFFYIDAKPVPTKQQALNMINDFLQSIVNAAKICADNHALHLLFNEMGCKFAPCLVGKSYGIIQLAGKLHHANQKEFKSPHDLMGAIYTELNLHAENDDMKNKILKRYQNQKFGEYVVTEEFVDDYLTKYILPDNNRAQTLSM